MKILYLIFSKLKNMIRTNLFITLMLCAGVFASNLMFTYFYGNFKSMSSAAGTLRVVVSQKLNKTQALELLPEYENEIYDVETYPDKSELIFKNLPEFAKERLYEQLNLTFGENIIDTEENPRLDGDFYKSIAIILLLYVACVFSLLYIMTYIYESYAYEMNIYEMLGASGGKITLALSSVQFIILIFASLLSQLVHAAFYDSFFFRLAWTERVKYTFSDYAAIFLITVTAAYSFIYIYMRLAASDSSIAVKRKVS